MAITRQKKEEIVEKVRAIAGKAKTLVFANFKGLTVAQQSEMRKTLRAQGIGYIVAKKTLLRRAIDGMPEIEGEVALVHSRISDLSAEALAEADELAPARELAPFVKKFAGNLGFAGGVFGGKFVSKAEIASIAAIPGLETLRAQFVYAINSPIQKLAIALSEIAKKK